MSEEDLRNKFWGTSNMTEKERNEAVENRRKILFDLVDFGKVVIDDKGKHVASFKISAEEDCLYCLPPPNNTQ